MEHGAPHARRHQPACLLVGAVMLSSAWLLITAPAAVASCAAPPGGGDTPVGQLQYALQHPAVVARYGAVFIGTVVGDAGPHPAAYPADSFDVITIHVDHVVAGTFGDSAQVVQPKGAEDTVVYVPGSRYIVLGQRQPDGTITTSACDLTHAIDQHTADVLVADWTATRTLAATGPRHAAWLTALGVLLVAIGSLLVGSSRSRTG